MNASINGVFRGVGLIKQKDKDAIRIAQVEQKNENGMIDLVNIPVPSEWKAPKEGEQISVIVRFSAYKGKDGSAKLGVNLVK